MVAMFKKYQGEWCVYSTDPLEPKATVEVTKRNGKTSTVTIDEIKVEGPGFILASIVSDRPTLTTRERKERKAERLREWAEKHDAKADAAGDRALDMASVIPFGQPILVGHHSEKRDRNYRGRIEAGFRKAAEESATAKDQRQRADGIEHQLDTSIYDDDPDAIERLAERIEILEGERDRIKRFNATARKGEPDFSILTDREKADLASIVKHAPYQLGSGGQFPSYKLSNLGGNITRYRKRLAALERRQG